MNMLRNLWNDRPSRLAWGISFVLLIALVVIVLGFGDLSSDALPLHYSVYFGIDLYGSGQALLWYVVIGWLVLILNVIIAAWLVERETLASRLVAWSSVVVITILLAATTLIVFFEPV
jgi:hypothetical protein